MLPWTPRRTARVRLRGPSLHALSSWRLRRFVTRTYALSGLEEFWPILFEAMLEGWVRDEAFWPKDRTLEMFQEWFEIQMCSIVQDLDMNEPLQLD